MGPDLVLNDLSFTPARRVDEARERMDLLIQTLRTAVDTGTSRRLRTAETFPAAVLAPDYTLPQWQADHSVDRTAQEYLLTLQQMAPPLRELPDQQEELQRSDYWLGQHKAETLGSAALAGGLGISLLSDDCWDTPQVVLRRERLDPAASLEPDVDVLIRHASRPAHLKEHADWIQAFIDGQVRSGLVMWERRKALYPSLDFCEKSKKYIVTLGLDGRLRQLLTHLGDLEAFCRSWREGPFDFRQIPGEKSPESKATLEQYSRERTYMCSDGVERLFDYHLKLADGWRIYIHPDAGPGRLFIGHVGPHLRTVKFH